MAANNELKFLRAAISPGRALFSIRSERIDCSLVAALSQELELNLKHASVA